MELWTFFEPVRYRVDLIYFPQINLNFLLFRCESEIKVLTTAGDGMFNQHEYSIMSSETLEIHSKLAHLKTTFVRKILALIFKLGRLENLCSKPLKGWLLS